MFYEGDLPLRNGTDLVEKFKNYFSKKKLKRTCQTLHPEKKEKVIRKTNLKPTRKS
jgi:hypothetical protein